VWGVASDGDNIVWGTAADGDNVVWGTSLDANLIWATSADEDATWGSSGDDQIVYPEDLSEPLPDVTLEFGEEVPLAPSLDVESVDVMPTAPVINSTLKTVTSVSIGGI
jgi:hypothetical protein